MIQGLKGIVTAVVPSMSTLNTMRSVQDSVLRVGNQILHMANILSSISLLIGAMQADLLGLILEMEKSFRSYQLTPTLVD